MRALFEEGADVEIHRKPEPVVYDVPEIAVLLNINRITAYQLAKKEGFPAVRIGRRIIVPKQAFHRWLDRQVAAGE